MNSQTLLSNGTTTVCSLQISLENWQHNYKNRIVSSYARIHKRTDGDCIAVSQFSLGDRHGVMMFTEDSELPYANNRDSWPKLNHRHIQDTSLQQSIKIRGIQVPVLCIHYSDVTMSLMESQITSMSTISLTFLFWRTWRKHRSSTSLACVRGIDR